MGTHPDDKGELDPEGKKEVVQVTLQSPLLELLVCSVPQSSPFYSISI